MMIENMGKLKYFSKISLIVIFFLTCFLLLPKQSVVNASTYGRVGGRVIDFNGNGMENVEVKIDTLSLGQISNIRTNGQGYYYYDIDMPGPGVAVCYIVSITGNHQGSDGFGTTEIGTNRCGTGIPVPIGALFYRYQAYGNEDCGSRLACNFKQFASSSISSSSSSSSSSSRSCSKKNQGDANCDGIVNDFDYQDWKEDYKKTRETCSPGKKTDFNGDGCSTLLDFEIWRSGRKEEV